MNESCTNVPDLDVEAVLADAPLKPDLFYNSKNCVRLNINVATHEQLQAELMRLDHLLDAHKAVKSKAENTYKARKRIEDPEFRRRESEAKMALMKKYRSEAKKRKARSVLISCGPHQQWPSTMQNGVAWEGLRHCIQSKTTM